MMMTSSPKLQTFLSPVMEMLIISGGGSGTAGGRCLIDFFNSSEVWTRLPSAKVRIREVKGFRHIGQLPRKALIEPLAPHWSKHPLQKEWPQLTIVCGSLNISKQMEQVISSSKDLRALSKGSLEVMVTLGSGKHFRRLAQKKKLLPELNKAVDPSCSWKRLVPWRTWVFPLISFIKVSQKMN